MPAELGISALPPHVMFLLDRSGSMMDTDFDLGDPSKTRWQVLYEGVEGIVGNGADADVAFGAKTFSTMGQGACGVSDAADITTALDNAASLLAAIPGPMAVVNGGTPTTLAVEKTMAIMDVNDSGGAPEFIFLITDGRIGCTDDTPEGDAQALADAVAILEDGVASLGVTTYVIGIAPSEFGPVMMQLEAMAVAGGAPNQGNESYYQADNADQLDAALAEVLADAKARNCAYGLEGTPMVPELATVTVSMTEYGLVQDCGSEDGFVYTDLDNTRIELCGAACAAVGEDPLSFTDNCAG